MLSTLLLAIAVGGKPAVSPRTALSSIRRFEQNAGQWPRDVLFVARTPRGPVVLGAADARLHLRTADGRLAPIRLIWDRTSSSVTGLDRLAGVSNYLTGPDPATWRSQIAGFSRVRYSEVAPHVDLEFYGAREGFEYDLVVHPGGDPAAVSFRVDGVSGVRVDAGGGLVFGTAGGAVRQRAPVAYQERNGVRTQVDVRYELRNGRIALRTGRFDRTKPLVIDPTVDFSSFLGGGLEDKAAAVASDAAGSLYVTGSTRSLDFPDTGGGPAGGSDAFVAKFSPDGSSLVYATYLGGSADDTGNAIAVSATGSAYVGGGTASTDFPVAAAFQPNNSDPSGFVARLAPDGASLVFSTYIGGSNTEQVEGLAIDGAGNAYVTGATRSADFPLQNAFRTAAGGSFVTKLAASGALGYSTYFGDPGDTSGISMHYRVNLHAIAVDSAGAAYVGGDSRGALLPATPGAYITQPGPPKCTVPGVFPRERITIPCLDGVVAKLSPGGSLLYATYLRGDETNASSPDDSVSGIAVDGAGNAHVAGTTRDPTFPATPGAATQRCTGPGCSSVFVTKLNASGSSLLFSAILGSASRAESGTGKPAPITAGPILNPGAFSPAIAIDSLGQTLVAGWTTGTDLPAINAQQPRIGSPGVARVSNAGAVAARIDPPAPETWVYAESDGTLYATGGEIVPGYSAFKSVDHGVTWTPLPVPAGTTSVVRADPNSSAILYTSAARSADGGQTWTPLGRVLNAPPVVRPGASNVLFGVASDSLVLKSVDSGASWTPSDPGIAPSDKGGLIRIAPSDPNVMYYAHSGLYISTDGGTTWTQRPVPNAPTDVAVNPGQPLMLYVTNFQGVWKTLDAGLVWSRRVDGVATSVVAASATTMYATTLDGLFVSTDTGNIWTLVPDLPASTLGPDKSSSDAVFVRSQVVDDGFVAALSPAGALVYASYLGGLGTDVPSGVTTTSDGGFAIVGSTTSRDFPAVNALQPSNAGGLDAFVTKLRFPQPLLSVEAPASGVAVFQPFTLRGWTLDRGAATNDGIDTIHVWALPAGGGATFVAAVTPAIARPDIAARFGPQFTTSGFSVPVSGLAPGSYTFALFAHSSVTNAFAAPQLLPLTLTTGNSGLVTIEAPLNGAATAAGAKLRGWAIDRAAPADTGISTIHVWAFPNPGSGQAPIFAGVPTYGLARPDIGAVYGSQFTNAGFELVLPQLPAGTYQFYVFPLSTVSNGFLPPATVIATLAPSRPNGWIDVPANGTTVSGGFLVAGWAIDQSAPDSTGVDAIHVYAIPASGAPIFLGVASYGSPRPDVGAIFGAQFSASGYSLNAPALPPGTYDVMAFQRSTVAGTFNFARTVRIIVP